MRWFSLSVLSILTAAAAAPVGAKPSSSQCNGDQAMTEHGKTTIIRTGEGHTARIVRQGDGTVRVEQHGKDHAALAVQSDDGSELDIEQSGERSSADVSQSGGCNTSSLRQSGNGNSARVVQNGSSNRAVIKQGKADD